MIKQVNIVCWVCLLFIALVWIRWPLFAVSSEQSPAIVVATISDLHGQLEPAYVWGPAGELQTSGGISRMATMLKTVRQRYPGKVLLLGSGDYFVEDFRIGKYFSVCQGACIAHFLNALGFDAATIGNHEYDFGLDFASRALAPCAFPLVVTNAVNTGLTVKTFKELIVNKNGYRIGLLGLMNPDVEEYGGFYDKPSNPLHFEPELCVCTQQAVNKLRDQDQVDFVVVLSHLGVASDKALAQAVDGIDVICGGHTHTVLKTNNEIIVDKNYGQKTLIVHAGDRGFYLGVLKLWPKKHGVFTWAWDLVDINQCMVSDQAFEEKLAYFRNMIPTDKVLATTTEPIDLSRQLVRTREAAFPNFVADVVRKFFNADIVLLCGASFRGRNILPAGPITDNDLNMWFPYRDVTLISLRIEGKYIKQALELAVAELPAASRNFLHVSGLRYSVNPEKRRLVPQKGEMGNVIGISSDGERVGSVLVQKDDSSSAPLVDDAVYSVVVNTFMVGPKRDFFMFNQGVYMHDTHLTEKEILVSYFLQHASFVPGELGRIKFL